ncbi:MULTISPECIES: helix-turn-helix domain-containing protein [unclassified Streptomyces]|uniref:helix-turn-helix domain-containing protein n=1 Tax=unclassified Streptomyces TaxID=2593676 RepID=UPI00278C6D75|nr:MULTISPECIES: helix-turn-helix transcriptional regulator [unclassified Streptomyces]
MLERAPAFGAELRRLRMAAELTLADLSSAVHYSKGQISKVETGHKRASAEFARLCDTALGAGGRLTALVPPEQPPSRRGVMTVGAASVLSLASAPRAAATPSHDEPSAAASLPEITLSLLAHYRQMGQVTPPSALLAPLTEQTRSVAALAADAGGRTSRALYRAAARFAEFTGWMAQEAGDDEAALRWTGDAVELAAAGEDHDLASYALVRRALITYYRGAAGDTVALVEPARDGRLPPRIRGLAAQRAAQGHALAGDHDACMRDLDTARALLTADVPAAADPARATLLGTSHLTDPAAMVTGWCLVDLGRPQAAASVLDRELARVPASALRTLARYGTRRALAHALSGDIDTACAHTADLLPALGTVASATVSLDVHRLTRTLARFHRHPAYRAIAPQLAAAQLVEPT